MTSKYSGLPRLEGVPTPPPIAPPSVPKQTVGGLPLNVSGEHAVKEAEETSSTSQGRVADTTEHVAEEKIPKASQSDDSLRSRHPSKMVVPQMPQEGTVGTSSRADHVGDVVFSHFEIPSETLQLFREYLHSEGEVKRRLEETVRSLLPTYTGGSVESVLHQFVEVKLGMKNFQLKAVYEGRSGGLVYKVIDAENGSVRFFIKMFKENTEILAKDVVSLDVLRQFPLRTSSSPHPMGVGKAVIDGGSYVFFAQTAAKGIPVTSLMSEVGSKEEGSKDREAAMQKLEVAIRHVGRSLAELWSVRVDQAAKVGPKVREEYLDELIWTTHDIEEVSRGIPSQDMALLQELDLQAIKGAAVFLKNRLSSRPELFGVPGYEHYDTNADNLFFDADKDHLTLIDTEGVLKTVGEDGNPIGFPMRDKIGFGENSIPNDGFKNGLTENEVRMLTAAFHQAYDDAISPAEKRKGPLCSIDAVNMMMLAKHSGATLSIFLKLKDGRETPERLRRHLAYEVVEIKAAVKKIEDMSK